ncbi:MAG TPA: DUF1501 domain-containing protein [Blastocatellia bacterium]|nr:DUF1501 domain-containing protein [Blastocatellia bacterium]
MNPLEEQKLMMTRRHFFGLCSLGLGAAALASLLGESGYAQSGAAKSGLPDLPHFAPKAKRVIYLYQVGGPSQLDLFDHKPQLEKLRGQNLPESIRIGQRLSQLTANESLPTAPSAFKFARHGKSGAWLSDLLPHTAKIVDEISFIKSMHTEQIAHDQALTFSLTGFRIAGRPSLGSWVDYGLGSENRDLPAFIVMVSNGRTAFGEFLYDRLWGSGFLSSRYQGVKFYNGPDPVLYLSNPPGVSKEVRRRFLDDLAELNQINARDYGDPEILSRVAQYEMAYRMQSSTPELMDLSKESEKTLERYGPDARSPGTFAFNCILARRMAERGVRFIQLFHQHWDQHLNLPMDIPSRAKETDQPSAALIMDLKERGMLDDTLVIWGGEFGRTVYSQGKLTDTNYGRDHHGRCFTVWLAGGGIKPGITMGETDDFSFNIASDPVHAHDLNATILHCLGIDHTRLTYKFQGRNFRLTDVEGNIVKRILS